MKFSITDLEKARRNPAEFAKNLKNADPSENKHGGYPKTMRWLDAVCAFHQNGDISEGFDKLEQGLGGRKPTKKHRTELETLLTALNEYKGEVTKRKLSLIKSREKIRLNINSEVEVSGIVPLIFMKPASGFSAYFISLNNTAWRNELKFPVVQSFIAETVFKTNVEEIEVGYIDYLTGEFDETSFSASELVAAHQELNCIGETIRLNL